MIFLPSQMKIEEAQDIIIKAPHIFTEEEIRSFEFKVSDIAKNGDTLEMTWIKTYKTLPQKELLHDPSIV